MSDVFLQLSKTELGLSDQRSTTEVSRVENDLNGPVEERFRGHQNQNRVEEISLGKYFLLKIIEIIRPCSNYRDLITEEEDGPRAPARLKSYDQRFNFYPSFPVERSMMLDFRAEQIHHLRTQLQAQTERVKSQYNIQDPYILPQRNKHRKKLVKRMSLLADQIEKYSMFSLAEHGFNEHLGVSMSSLVSLQIWRWSIQRY